MLIAPFAERQHRAPTMARRIAVLLGALVSIGTGCAPSPAIVPRQPARSPAASSAHESRSISPLPSITSGQQRGSTPSSAHIARAERNIADTATLPELLLIALANNPEIAEARDRSSAAREGDPAGSRLPDPEFEYQLWAQPLSQPYALGSAQMHMFGVRQAFPAPGSLGARAEAASALANVAAEARRARELDVVLRVRRAYAEYYRADREYRVHLEHVRVAEQMVDLAGRTYRAAGGSQRDVLRASLELSRLHNDVANIERDRSSARALLNSLMARAPDAPLGPPAAIELPPELRVSELETSSEPRRPEIAAAENAVQARASELDASRAAARWPSFMLGLQYMVMPSESERQNYGVTLSMSLPWLNLAHAEAVRAAEATLAAEKSALRGARVAARYELYEAIERLKAARRSLAIIERDLVPLARQSFESAQAAYRGGESDLASVLETLSALLEIRIERERALVRVDTAVADLERAVGGSHRLSRTTEHE